MRDSGKAYKDYGSRAEHLWMVCGGVRANDKIVDLDAPTFLQFPTRSGGERALICGINAIGTLNALESVAIPCRTWIRPASMVVSFDFSRFGEMKAAREKILGQGQVYYALNCSRSSVAAALRGYRRRRDAILRDEASSRGESCQTL